MLADNILHFTRVLRRAGLAVGPDHALQAVAAVEAVGLDHRSDVHAALSAVMLDRHEQQAIFDAAFETFWRDPKLLDKLRHALLPKVEGRGGKEVKPRPQRLEEALAPSRPDPAKRKPRPPQAEPPQEVTFDAALTFSERERLQSADFESMSTAEFELAKHLAERAPLPIEQVRMRRHESSDHGTIDLRRSLQHMVRRPDVLTPAFTKPRREWPPVVVLLDISGSMNRYSRLFLHYVHGLMRRLPRVHCFTFGTRLTDVTRCLRQRDPDDAMALAAQHVHDWRGGTRIASSLDVFNRQWSRRVLGGNAAVLLVTDGLERDDDKRLEGAIAMLHRSAHQLVWLNPLLRFAGFEPRAAGVRTMLAHVDRFLPVHNLDSLADLGRALRTSAPKRPAQWLHGLH